VELPEVELPEGAAEATEVMQEGAAEATEATKDAVVGGLEGLQDTLEAVATAGAEVGTPAAAAAADAFEAAATEGGKDAETVVAYMQVRGCVSCVCQCVC